MLLTAKEKLHFGFKICVKFLLGCKSVEGGGKKTKHWAQSEWAWYLGDKRSVAFRAPHSSIKMKEKLDNSCRS